MESRFLGFLALGFLTTLMACTFAAAAVFHVRNGPALQDALTICESNGEDDSIYLGSGIYSTGGGGRWFLYRPDPAGDLRSLQLIGEPGTSTGNVVVGNLSIYHSGNEQLSPRPVIEVAGITFNHADIVGQPYDIIIRNCAFRDGRYEGSTGGGLHVSCQFGKVTLENNLIIGNEVSDPYGYGRCEGGGLHVSQPSELVMINNVIAFNRANCPGITSQGGGAFIVAACPCGDPAGACVPKAYLIGNTVFGNEADEGAGIYQDVYTGNLLHYYNNILFGNAAALPGGSDLFFNGRSSAAEVNGFNNDYSGFSGGWTSSGRNISVDPDFVSPTANDFHLRPSSPLIGGGTSSIPVPPGLPLTDAEGSVRVAGSAPDMGAYEYEDRSGASAPVPDIQINGSDGPLTLGPTGTITVSCSLVNNGWTNRVDWWFVMGTSAGSLFSLTPFNWKEGLIPFYQGRLYDLPPVSFPSLPLAWLPAGQYNLVFGIDMNADGEVTWESVYFDFVTLNVTP